MNGSAYQGYRFAQFGPATHFSLGGIPPLRRSSADSSKQDLECFCATTGTFLPPTERSIRGNTSVGHRTRVLQPLLPCSKKGRRPETHSGSAASKPFPLQREVQDADNENDHVSDSRRGLVCHYRPKRCMLWHPATQEVPSVCLWREGLPIQGPSLWPGLGTENVHEVHGCCTGPLEVLGHSCSELLRRLAHSGPLQGVSESSQRYRSTPHSFSWPQNERQEECSLPLSANRVFGASLGFRSECRTQGCLPGFDAFYPRSWGASYNSQNRQYGGSVPHKPSGGFTVAHPGQARAPSSPLVPGQVPFLEGSSRSGNTEPCGRFSVETESGCWTVRWSPRFGICLAKRKWTSLLLKSHSNARSGSP